MQRRCLWPAIWLSSRAIISRPHCAWKTASGASAAYLTVSEIFPLEIRAQAIAIFFAIAQAFGLWGPHIYGHLIGDGTDHFKLIIAYLIGAGVMVLGGVVEIFLGVAAERRSLEEVASPIGMVPRIPEFGSGGYGPRRPRGPHTPPPYPTG